MTGIGDIEFRTLNYADNAETRAYQRLFWDLPLAHNEYFTRRSEEFLDEWIRKARENENPANTFSGIALHRGKIVGLHILHRYEEYDQAGAHIAGLWVRPEYQHLGIARTLKESGEQWARSVGATFINTNVHPANRRMLEINEQAGFSVFRYNLRKRL